MIEFLSTAEKSLKRRYPNGHASTGWPFLSNTYFGMRGRALDRAEQDGTSAGDLLIPEG
jgi:hypothetical protein